MTFILQLPVATKVFEVASTIDKPHDLHAVRLDFVESKPAVDRQGARDVTDLRAGTTEWRVAGSRRQPQDA